VVVDNISFYAPHSDCCHFSWIWSLPLHTLYYISVRCGELVLQMLCNRLPMIVASWPMQPSSLSAAAKKSSIDTIGFGHWRRTWRSCWQKSICQVSHYVSYLRQLLAVNTCNLSDLKQDYKWLNVYLIALGAFMGLRTMLPLKVNNPRVRKSEGSIIRFRLSCGSMAGGVLQY